MRDVVVRILRRNEFKGFKARLIQDDAERAEVILEPGLKLRLQKMFSNWPVIGDRMFAGLDVNRTPKSLEAEVTRAAENYELYSIKMFPEGIDYNRDVIHLRYEPLRTMRRI